MLFCQEILNVVCLLRLAYIGSLLWLNMLLRCAVLFEARSHRRRPDYQSIENDKGFPLSSSSCCCVCFDDLFEPGIIPVQFLPCEHAVCCLSCVVRLDTLHTGLFSCPICRASVRVVQYSSFS
jgi:hypothetical protein